MTDPRALDYETLRRIWRGESDSAQDMAIYNELYRAAVTMQRLEDAFAYEFTNEVPGRRSERPRFDPFDCGGQL